MRDSQQPQWEEAIHIGAEGLVSGDVGKEWRERGGFYTIEFDTLHRVEILMTAMQALLGFLVLANMRFTWYEAGALFLLWVAQFIYPGMREEILWVYGLYILIEIGLGLSKKGRIKVFGLFREVFREQIASATRK